MKLESNSKYQVNIEHVKAQKHFNEMDFPLILSPSEKLNPGSTDLAETITWLNENKSEMDDLLAKHGVIMFRGFKIDTAQDFDHFVNQGFQWKPLPYVGGAAPRTSVIGTVFTTNESPPDSKIPFHHEMAQVPTYPKRLFFYCDVPPLWGGETPICRSDVVYEAMVRQFPDFCESLEKLGVVYTRIMPEENDQDSPIGRGWKATYQTDDKAVVEQKCKDLQVDIEWLENGNLKTMTQRLDAIKVHPVTGKKVWFNSIVAAYTGWKDVRNDPKRAVTFGDGTPLEERAVLACLDIMNEVCVDIQWQHGDVFLIDNELALHARRTFGPPRKIYAALATFE